MTSKLSRNIQVQRAVYCFLVVWPFQHLQPTKSLRHRESSENQTGKIRAPETTQSCQSEPGIPDLMFPILLPGQAGSTTVGTAGTLPMPLAVLHLLTAGLTNPMRQVFHTLPNPHQQCTESCLSEGVWEASHLLTILLSLLA